MNVTLVVPSRNNLKYVKKSYESIRKYIGEDTEVVLMDDASTDGTWEWMKSVESPKTKIYRNNGPERIGHTVLYDVGAQMASNKVFGIFHADMIASTTYLPNMIKHVKRGTVVSGTRIEPPLHPPGPEKHTMDFGLEPEEFQETPFLQYCLHVAERDKDKTTSGIFAPWMMYVEDLLSIGGHDKRLFAPMELEDSDLFNRFKLAGYQFVQARDALAYHLTCRGSRYKDGVQIHMEIPIGNGRVWKRSKDSEEYTTLRHIKFREWWRKWHMNVLHDEMMMPKVCKRYDIGYVIHNAGVMFGQFEPWGDTIYADLQPQQLENYIVNEETTSHYDIRKRIKPLSAEKTNNIIVEFDARNFKQEHFKFIEDMMFIIQDSGEVGQFEYECFKFDIRSMESYEDKLINADDPWLLNQLKN